MWNVETFIALLIILLLVPVSFDIYASNNAYEKMQYNS